MVKSFQLGDYHFAQYILPNTKHIDRIRYCYISFSEEPSTSFLKISTLNFLNNRVLIIIALLHSFNQIFPVNSCALCTVDISGRYPGCFLPWTQDIIRSAGWRWSDAGAILCNCPDFIWEPEPRLESDGGAMEGRHSSDIGHSAERETTDHTAGGEHWWSYGVGPVRNIPASTQPAIIQCQVAVSQ